MEHRLKLYSRVTVPTRISIGPIRTERLHSSPLKSTSSLFTPYSNHLRRRRAGYGYSSKSPKISNEDGDEHIDQEHMKSLMAAELFDICVCCPDIIKHMKAEVSNVFLSEPNPEDLEYVCSTIHQILKLHCQKLYKGKKWPKKREDSYYDVFYTFLDLILYLLNKAFSTRMKKQPKLKDYPYLFTRFIKYGHEIPTPDQNNLKPDGVAVSISHKQIPSSFCDNQHYEPFFQPKKLHVALGWDDALLFSEVGADWAKLYKQGATYARGCFSSNPSRQFVVGVLYQYVKAECAIAFFHRSGVTHSNPYPLKFSIQNGTLSTRKKYLEPFLRLFCSVAMLKDGKEAGFDPGRWKSYFLLSDLGVYHKEKQICRRDCVAGRATEVYRLQLVKGVNIQEIDVNGLTAYTAEVEKHTLIHTPPVDWARKPHPPPEQLIIKYASAYAEQYKEIDIFRSVKGHLGLIDIYGEFEVDSFAQLLCHDHETHSNQFCQKETSLKARMRRGIIIATDGSSLERSAGPRRLLQAILDALCGHYTLLCKAKYLHRDVSIDNILVLGTPQATQHSFEPEAMSIYEEMIKEASKKKDTKQAMHYATDELREAVQQHYSKKLQTGILIDGDHAKKWGDSEEFAFRSHLSGTKEFMSRHILMQWSQSQAKIIHTQIDDLESFLWVLIYTIIYIVSERLGSEVLSDGESQFLRTVSSSNIDTLKSAKENLLLCLCTNKLGSFPILGYFIETKRLPLREWALHVYDMAVTSRNLEKMKHESAALVIQRINQISHIHCIYGGFLLPAWNCLFREPQLTDEWKYIIEALKERLPKHLEPNDMFCDLEVDEI